MLLLSYKHALDGGSGFTLAAAPAVQLATSAAVPARAADEAAVAAAPAEAAAVRDSAADAVAAAPQAGGAATAAAAEEGFQGGTAAGGADSMTVAAEDPEACPVTYERMSVGEVRLWDPLCRGAAAPGYTFCKAAQAWTLAHVHTGQCGARQAWTALHPTSQPSLPCFPTRVCRSAPTCGSRSGSALTSLAARPAPPAPIASATRCGRTFASTAATGPSAPPGFSRWVRQRLVRKCSLRHAAWQDSGVDARPPAAAYGGSAGEALRPWSTDAVQSPP